MPRLSRRRSYSMWWAANHARVRMQPNCPDTTASQLEKAVMLKKHGRSDVTTSADDYTAPNPETPTTKPQRITSMPTSNSTNPIPIRRVNTASRQLIWCRRRHLPGAGFDSQFSTTSRLLTLLRLSTTNSLPSHLYSRILINRFPTPPLCFYYISSSLNRPRRSQGRERSREISGLAIASRTPKWKHHFEERSRSTSRESPSSLDSPPSTLLLSALISRVRSSLSRVGSKFRPFLRRAA